MDADKPLSICYIVPGHNLLPSAGPTRHVLSVARALGEYARVTVAFRRVVEPIVAEHFTVAEIDPQSGGGAAPVDDASMRGIGYGEFARYLRALRRFSEAQLPKYDVVLEKSWFLSGHVSAWCTARGIPAMPVLNIVPVLDGAWRAPAKAGRTWIAREISGHYLRRLPLLIAESPTLKSAIAQRWKIPPERIEVVGLGVDRAMFRPQDQAEARQRLGIAKDDLVLLYVGALDRAHDLKPLLEAVVGAGDPTLRLHVVGDGELRGELERRAGTGGPVKFHGRVPHRDVPTYIASADLCVAPYDPRLFPGGEIGYATLKVREYLAAGRPVVTAPSGLLPDLIRAGETGFSLENDVPEWMRFLQRTLPSRERLREMGASAAALPLETWADAARRYHALCERMTRARPGRPVAAAGVL